MTSKLGDRPVDRDALAADLSPPTSPDCDDRLPLLCAPTPAPTSPPAPVAARCVCIECECCEAPPKASADDEAMAMVVSSDDATAIPPSP